MISVLKSILSAETAVTSLTIPEFLLCTLGALLLGTLIAFLHMYRSRCSQNFIITLALLPIVIQAVIMLVNGNLGTGVAVMGAFSLVRFRSLPGNSREIGSIFLAMAIGLACGMGYLGIAFLLFLVVALATILLLRLPLNVRKRDEKSLKITIPENLDYLGIFDSAFEQYTVSAQLLKVKTVNMGSLFELDYLIILKNSSMEKLFLDDLRCRNGNLSICCGRVACEREEL